MISTERSREHVHDGTVFCAKTLWTWPWVAGIALVLIGLGGNAVFGKDYLAARFLIYGGLAFLTAKALTDLISTHDKRAGKIFIALLVLAVFVIAIEGLIAYLQFARN